MQFTERTQIIHSHSDNVKKLQEEIRDHIQKPNRLNSSSFLAMNARNGSSNTTHSKSYKQKSLQLDFSSFDRILSIDPIKQIAWVEPRVTFDALVQALLPYGLTVPVIPEFKGMTIGGAIMGAAGESSSFLWGCFHDICLSYEILCGDGSLIKITPHKDTILFHGIAGSFGSLALLMSVEIQLIPAREFVRLKIDTYPDPMDALHAIQELTQSSTPPDFLDGIIFSPGRACVMRGYFESKDNFSPHLPHFSMQSIYSEWFAQHVQNITFHTQNYEEVISFSDYAFRYDRGGFWMGSFLTQLPFLTRLLSQGVLDSCFKRQSALITYPGLVKRCLSSSFVTSQSLWKFLHRSEKWLRKQFLIQDLCIPSSKAVEFFQEIEFKPGIYPLWICPIKGTRHPQIFAPHFLPENERSSQVINFGLYGIPRSLESTDELLTHIEKLTMEFQGRKVLYSHSCYTKEQFWQIYSKANYDNLRKLTGAEGVFHSIEEKVLLPIAERT